MAGFIKSERMENDSNSQVQTLKSCFADEDVMPHNIALWGRSPIPNEVTFGVY
jgi:hypothetical protein